MTDIVNLIKSLPNMLPLQPATEIQIKDAELQLRNGFSDEYKAYLAAFGAVMADGIELTGIAKADHRNVVSLTKQERKLNPKVPLTMYVVENTCVDGAIIWQDTNGAVYQTRPHTAPAKIADSLAEYLGTQRQ